MIKYNLVNALTIDNINLLKILKGTDLQLDGFFCVYHLYSVRFWYLSHLIMLKCIESLTSPTNLLYEIDANYSQFAKILP